MSTNTSVYYVDVNSNYRNLEQYPNPADFAVTFSTFTATGSFPQGLPLNSESFFQQASIDPDWVDADLQVFNGNIQQYKRLNDVIYIAGSYDNYSNTSTGTFIKYGSTGIFTFDSLSSKLVSQTSLTIPYLARVDRVENQFMPYNVNWVMYSSPSGGWSSDGYRSSFKISDNGNIFWAFDFDTPLDIKVKQPSGNTYFLYQNINSGYGQTVVAPPQSVGMIYVTPDANLALYNGANWGYHVFSSKSNTMYNPNTINENVSNNFNFEVDTGNNIYTVINEQPSEFSIAPLIQNQFAVTSVSSSNPSRFYQYTGINGQDLIIVPYRYPNTYSSSVLAYTGAFHIYSSSSTGLASLNNQTSLDVQPTQVGGLQEGRSVVDWVEVGSNLYCVRTFLPVNPTGDSYTGTFYPIDNLGPYYYKYDKTGTKFDYQGRIATGANLGLFLPASTSIGNNIYTFGTQSITGASPAPLRAYSFNTSTNTSSLLATLQFTGTTFGQSRNVCFSSGSNIYVISTDADVMFLGDDKPSVGYVAQFNPGTNALVNYSLFTGPSSSLFNYTIQNRDDGNKYLFMTYYGNPFCQIYDITNLSNVRLVSQIQNEQSCNALPFKIYDGATPHYFLTLGSNSFLNKISYNIDDVTNPVAITTQFTNDGASFIDNKGYSYFATLLSSANTLGKIPSVTPYLNSTGTMIYRSKNYTTSELDSSHYNLNVSNTATGPTSATAMVTFYHPYSDTNILVTANSTEIRCLDINNPLNVTTLLSQAVGYAGVPTIIKTYSFGGNQWIFISVNNLVYVYTVSLNSAFALTTKETVTFALGTVQDMQIYDQYGILFLILFNSSNQMIIYGQVGVFTAFSLFNFTASASYTVFGNQSFVFFDEVLGFQILVALCNSSTLPGSALAVFVVISDPTAPVIVGTQTVPATSNTYKALSQTLNQGQKLVFIADKFGAIGLYNITSLTRPVIIGVFYSYTDINIDNFNTTAYTSNEKAYVAFNGSSYGSSTDFLTLYNAYDFDPLKTYSKSENVVSKINLPARCLCLANASINNRITVIALLNNNTIFFYDVTNPEYANLYQTVTQTQTQYRTNLINFNGGSFVNKLLPNGTSNWATYVGTNLNQGSSMGGNIHLSNCQIDTSEQNIYLAGNFSREVEYYNYTSTGSYQLKNKITNTASQGDAFTMRIATLDGHSSWLTPFIGTDNTFINELKYSSSDNTAVVCGYSTSPSMLIYQTQSAGTTTNPTIIQKTVNTNSLGSGFLTKLTSAGAVSWNSLLYSDDSAVLIQNSALSVDSSKISVVGRGNFNTMRTLDGTNAISQILYSDINRLTQYNAFLYTYNQSGQYQQSNLIKFSPDISGLITQVEENAEDDEIVIIGNSTYNSSSNTTSYYNKDGTLGESKRYQKLYPISPIVRYQYDSTYYDINGLPYSQIVFSTGTSYTFTGGAFENYSLYLGGASGSTGINKSFSVRNNFTGPYNKPSILLNQVIPTRTLDRQFGIVNNIPDSEDYYFANLSKSPLTAMVRYNTTSINTGANQITITSPNAIDSTKSYYIVYPFAGGLSEKVIPITNIQQINSSQYILTLTNITELQSPTGGSYYGPYLNLSAFNQSLYYNLQFFPSSLASPVYYNVRLQSMTIPNRPLLNLEQYGGARTLNDLPFIYLSVYNTDDNGNYDDQIVNVVYDNTPVGVRPYPIFQIPVSNQSAASNFATFSSDMQPVVKFSPTYNNIRIRLLDMDGNPLQFDTSSTKSSDLTFNGGIPPTYLTNIYLRMAFTKRA